ncbi:MAG TPA: chromate transporter [Halanaerobiales bacterium]|nr:chromate transporter [Halanaerobiales bacterium]
MQRQEKGQESKQISLLWAMFASCFKIGLFTFGGGFAMIPLMEKEFVENKGWISKHKFMSTISAVQSIPGAVAINLSIFLGYNIAGISGAIFTALGVALPSFIVILLIAIGFYGFSEYPLVINAFRGIRPAVVALIIFAGYRLSKNIDWSFKLVIAFVLSLILTGFFGINPVWPILTAILIAFLYHFAQAKKEREEQQETTSA